MMSSFNWHFALQSWPMCKLAGVLDELNQMKLNRQICVEEALILGNLQKLIRAAEYIST